MPARSSRIPAALRSVLTTYDLGALRAVTPLRGGRMAQSWRVNTAAGAFVLRRAEPDLPGRLPLAQRQQLLLHLASRLPEVPRLIPNARGQTVTEHAATRYELLAFIEGDTLDEAAGAGALPAETVAAAARLLARYHRAAAAFSVSPSLAAEGPRAPGEEVAARWERLRASLAGSPQEVLPELRGAACERLAEWVRSLQEFWTQVAEASGRKRPASPLEKPANEPDRPDHEPPSGGFPKNRPVVYGRMPGPVPWLWVHGDYTPYNLVYRGGFPVGLLDFGAVQWMPAAYDLAIALLSFPGAAAQACDHRPTTNDHRRQPNTPGLIPPAFLAAYAAERPLSAAELAALPLLMLHRRVIAALWIAEECLAGRVDLRHRLVEYLSEGER